MQITSSFRTLARVLSAGALVLATAAPALAGPPLICFPFDAGNARLLPWADMTAQRNWKSPDPTYDVTRLTADTLALLTPDAPILARMENMRRATIYAMQNPQVAAELLKAVTARVQADAGKGNDPLAWFDAGYLIESYRQAGPALKVDLLATGGSRPLDGYGMVTKAIAIGGTPEMEFAASLMKEGAASRAHLQRASAGAAQGSLLAKNIATHFEG